MNGTESSATSVPISEKCKKSSTSLSDAKVVQKSTFLAYYQTIIRHDTNIDIMLRENDSIITESETVAQNI